MIISHRTAKLLHPDCGIGGFSTFMVQENRTLVKGEVEKAIIMKADTYRMHVMCQLLF